MYLAVILDRFARRVVGYALSRNIDTALCLEALRMALALRRPPKGIVHHSDRGVQYAANDYVKELLANGVTSHIILIPDSYADLTRSGMI